MADFEYDGFLFIEDDLEPQITVTEAEQLKPIQIKFIDSLAQKGDDVPVENWLQSQLAESLPEYKEAEVAEMSKEIISTLITQEEKKASLDEALANGRSKESWFASEMKSATSQMSAEEASKYLHGLDNSLENANESLFRTIRTQNGAGAVSQNPSLDGYIAEQYHAQTFNMNAEAAGSPYRAKVLEPNGNGYAKNSVDIEIVDGSGKVVRRYQSKYCKNADATAKAFEKGDYRGQQKLVPEGQETNITKKCTTVIESPDGVTSNPLSKARAKELQAEAQSGKWNDLNWNEYKAKDLAIGIGQQAGQAALMGAAIGAGFNVAQKVWNGEKIDGGEVAKAAIVSGADFGVKAAAAGALKVGVEKGLVRAIPKGTPAGIIANIAFVGVENAKVVYKMAKGELSLKEGAEKMEQVTVSTAAGSVAAAKGTALGATYGSVFGPVGTAIGGFIGGTVGYMAGSKVGEVVVKGAQKVRRAAVKAVKTIGADIVSTAKSVASGIKSFCSGLKSCFCN